MQFALLVIGLCVAASGGALEDGATAPDGCWTTSGGSASRSGVARTPGVYDEPELAWSFAAGGEIESEPLVWGERIVLVTRDSGRQRTLLVLDRETGKQRLGMRVPSSVSLEPALWGDWLALRYGRERTDLYRFNQHRMELVRNFVASAPVSAPLLFEEELYVREGDQIARYDAKRREPVWRTRARGRFRGRPALLGEHLYAVWYDARGYAHLASIQRSDGSLAGDTIFGHHGGTIPAAKSELDVRVLGQEVFVDLPLPISASDGGSYRSVRVRRNGEGFPRQIESSLHDFRVAPVTWGEGWAVLENTSERGARWVASSTEGTHTRSVVLASDDNHPRLLEAQAAIAIAADVFYLADLAVSSEDFRILWRMERQPRLRPVPADGLLLVVDGPATLVALRSPRRHRNPRQPEARARALELEASLGESFAALAVRALRGGDLELCRRLIAEASRRRASERSLQRALEGLALLEQRSSAGQRSGSRFTQALLMEERELFEGALRKLLFEAQSSNDPDLERAFLGELLARSSEHPQALEAVRDLVPAGAPLVDPFDGRSWLDFLEVHAGTPVRFVTEANPTGSEGEKTLARERAKWRSDLDGYQSGQLFIITPPGRPGAVARCLEVGELVCDALEDIFGTRRGSERLPPLTLLLYETRDEYQTQSQREGSAPELARGWTGGHYSTAENLSRMYVPGDDEGLERLLGVYAHELTHHWLAARAPFAARGWRAGADQPGYWIAEGFATLIEEFRFEPHAHTWSTDNPRADSLDTLANARPEDLVPWDAFFAMSHARFQRLDATPDRKVSLTWRLGAQGRVSQISLFYAQAGAVCHYLHTAEGGRHREALLDYQEHWITARGKRFDVEEAFGLGAEELGERALAFARSAVGE